MGHKGVWGGRNDDDGYNDGKGGLGPSWKGDIVEKGRSLQHHEGTSFSNCNQINTCSRKWKQDHKVVGGGCSNGGTSWVWWLDVNGGKLWKNTWL